ncbi:MAG: T9SS type A sorting domain-containing protein [Prolixibacteraceae bacterium]|nr:T9SS type A sorting domain-containing protein [Prolixibacteraceae bacterium]
MKTYLLLIIIFQICLSVVKNSWSQAIPQQNGNIYSITTGDVSISVDASKGARIVSFKNGDKELLLQTSSMQGSTLWTSPQSEWNWPPLSTTDSKAYSVTIEGGRMIFESNDEKGISGRKFRFRKAFWANENDHSITIRYTIINVGTSSFTNGLWSVTRVLPEGITFWMTGNKDPWGSTLVNHIDEIENFSWIEYKQSNGINMKFFTDIGSAGWYAHTTPDNYMLVKSFEEDVPDTEFAPGEGELEYWVDGSTSYIELENQSAYTTLAPGEDFHYYVTWHLVKLPESVNNEKGNAGLVDFAQQLVDGESQITSGRSIKTVAKIFPNPVNDAFKVVLNGAYNNARMTLYDLLGNVVYNAEVHSGQFVNISHLKNGVYFYRLLDSDGEQYGKLIKQ